MTLRVAGSSSLLWIVVAALGAGCGGDGAAADAGSDLPVPSDGATPPTDLAAVDLSSVFDDAFLVDLAPPPGADGGGLELFVGKYFVGQNCQPIVPPDPVSAFIDVFFTNRGAAPVGPLRLYGGAILDGASGKPLLDFDFEPQNDWTVAANAQVNLHFVKAAGSGRPARGCGTLQCNMAVKVVAAWGPPGGVSRQSITSQSTKVECVF